MPSHQDRREPLPADYQFPTPRNCYRIGFLSYHLIDPKAIACRCGGITVDDGNPFDGLLTATQIH